MLKAQSLRYILGVAALLGAFTVAGCSSEGVPTSDVDGYDPTTDPAIQPPEGSASTDDNEDMGQDSTGSTGTGTSSTGNGTGSEGSSGEGGS